MPPRPKRKRALHSAPPADSPATRRSSVGSAAAEGEGPTLVAVSSEHVPRSFERSRSGEPLAPALTVPAVPPALDDGPLIFLSGAQAAVCARYEELAALQLPCWAPQVQIERALGHSEAGVTAAVASLRGQNYVWATEFENVHGLWRYDEPAIVVGDQQYSCSEEFYHSQKPAPWDEVAWDSQKEAVMEAALRAKLAADPRLASLLRATGRWPLLSLKRDEVWGFDPVTGRGQNLLARLWMKLREEVLLRGAPLTM
jgi:hypothetical protein